MALITVPILTTNGLNAREDWHKRSARVKREREETQWFLNVSRRPLLPVSVVLRRISPNRKLDKDNLQGSLKGVRDQVAAWLHVDDSNDLVTWFYRQERREKDRWAVEIDFRVWVPEPELPPALPDDHYA